MLNNLNSYIKYQHSKDIHGNRSIYSAKISRNIPDEHYHEDTIIQNNKSVGLSYPKHRPLKIYRKQYTASNTKSNLSAIGVFDKPGLSSYNNNSELCKICPSNNLFNDNIINSNNNYKNCSKYYFDNSLNKLVCISLNPENNIIKSASTIISKNYSYNNNQYLFKKNKLFTQNQSTKFLSGQCCSENSINYKTGSNIKSNNHSPNITYCTNINNQSSVSSSSRIARLKYDTTQKYKSKVSNYEQQVKNFTNNPQQCRKLLFKNNVLQFPCS